MKKKATAGKLASGRFIYILIFILGAVAFLYPLITNTINQQTQTQLIVSYEQEMKALDQEQKESIFQEAQEYNRFVAGLEGNVTDEVTDDERAANEVEYLSVLSAGSTIGHISIPKIDVELPILKGASDEMLSIGIGHLERSSLPVGGVDTHSVLVGHRGLPTSRLFRDLHMLNPGDIFIVDAADEKLAYEVEATAIVKPDDVETLGIQEGRDLCTLVTCEPYMVNSHRLLVTGHRVEYVPEQEIQPESHITFFEKYWEYFVIVASFSALMLAVWAIRRRIRKKRQGLAGGEDDR